MSEPHDEQPDPVRGLGTWLELVRLPNLFTAMADPAMGMVFVFGGLPAVRLDVLALLLIASSCLYAAGVVLNDLFDIEVDRRERPDRPLPSGRISRRAAVLLAGELMLIGLAAAWLAAALVGHLLPGIVAIGLAGCIFAYDALLKRTPVGPLGMGACRMLNVLLGMSIVPAPWHTEHWLVAGGMGLYITGIAWFARTEAGQSRRLPLAMALAVMISGIALMAAFPRFFDRLGYLLQSNWHMLMGVLGALIAWRCLRAVAEPNANRVQMAVKHAILSLVILDAAVCLYVGGQEPAMLVLLLLIPAAYLGRWIKMT